IGITKSDSYSTVIQDFLLDPETHPGEWAIIGETNPEYLDATNIGILLPDGQILWCHDTKDAQLFDPVTGAKTLLPPSSSFQGCAGPSLLTDGRVILFGGQKSQNFTDATKMVKTFDYTTLTWDTLQPMNEFRWYPAVSRLTEGDLLVIGGGQPPNAQRTATCELFDIQAEVTTYTDSVAQPNEFSPTALLFTGEVLATWAPCQLYNPVTQEWRTTGNFVQPDRGFPGHSDHSLVVLPDGRALAIGCRSSPNPVMGEIYNPNTETWSLTANLYPVRDMPEVVLLPDGRVFVGGGHLLQPDTFPSDPVQNNVKLCDLYDPVRDSWRRLASWEHFKEYHATTLLLPDGRIVTTGGTNIAFTNPTSYDIEAFSPPYLFRGVRPQIVTLSSTDLYRGQTVTFDIFPQTALTEAVLIGTQAVTHWIDGGIPRLLRLPFTQTGTQVTATVPADPDSALLGWYIFFAMVDDIPSEGVIVRVLESTPGVDEEIYANPFGFYLYQNSPNPFHSTTTIRYILPAVSNQQSAFSRKGIVQVHLAVYDITGRLVVTLVNKSQESGVYQVQWDSRIPESGVPSGIYFYRLKAGDLSATRKIVILR
ncbi:DUF1929 domain-containing protein, partial [candidate division TA06 bacterium]|nr:DUF1929 domain-containing protein [candidate division TA06 bacterium]